MHIEKCINKHLIYNANNPVKFSKSLASKIVAYLGQGKIVDLDEKLIILVDFQATTSD